MGDVNITFESLFEILGMEKKRHELQELPETFFDDVRSYLNEKQKILEIAEQGNSEDEVKRIRKQIANIYRILDELYNRREIKIVNLALIKSKTSSDSVEGVPMLEEELKLFNSIKELLEEHKRAILERINKAELPKETVKIRFNDDIPEFIGRNMKKYGPFLKGSTAELPKKIAEILVKSNKAEYER